MEEGYGDSIASLPENLAGALAYFTFVPAIFFLLVEPYSRNRFVRFHCFNCLFLHAGVVAAGLLITGMAALLTLMASFLRVLLLPLGIIFLLAAFALWLLLVMKAYQHEIYKLPLVGDMAERQAGA